MTRYLIRRLLFFIPVLLGVYTLVFILMHATPGGPWDRSEKPLTQAAIDRLNAKYKLDRPLYEQYFDYLWGVVTRFDFGPSYRNATQTVTEIIQQFFPVSLQIGSAAMLLALIFGVSLGTISALKPNTWVDYSAVLFSIIGYSVPVFVIAPVLVVIFAVWLNWLPTGGWDGLFTKSAILPIVTLAIAPTAALARYSRSSILEVTRADYVRTARAKGLAERAVLWRHILANAFIPIVTVAGLYLAFVVTGSFFVESILRVPGIGRYFVKSIQARDYPVIMGTALLLAFLITVMNLVVDLMYGFLDPRIRFE
jgi:ABC-type dipeptide/oligopeptide/nickel transport system permease component